MVLPRIAGWRDRPAATLEPAVLLPSQHEARIDTATPEKRLMLAVLADAIYTYRRTAKATDDRARRLFVETARWFATPETGEPFAFQTICDILGLDANYVRRGLKGTFDQPRRPLREPVANTIRNPTRAAG